MTAIEVAAEHDARAGGGGGYWRRVLRRLRARRLAFAAAVCLAILAVIAIFADVIAPYDPAAQLLERPAGVALDDPLAPRETGKFLPPSWMHPFGTDHLARDIFSRTVIGLRISLGAALVAGILVAAIGISLGTLAAVGPRFVDSVVMRLTDLAYAFPVLLLVILLRAVLGGSAFGQGELLGLEADVLLLFVAIALASWPTMARLVRGQLLAIRELDHVLAAESLGCSKWRIATRHMLPLAMGPMVVELVFLVPRVIAAEAALSFIGIGAEPPTPSLGLLIQDHFRFVGVQWTALAIPTALLALIFVVMQLLGDGLRDALDPRSP